MRDYEVTKHKCWSEEAVQMLKVIMNRNILLMVNTSRDTCGDTAQPEVRNSQITFTLRLIIQLKCMR